MNTSSKSAKSTVPAAVPCAFCKREFASDVAVRNHQNKNDACKTARSAAAASAHFSPVNPVSHAVHAELATKAAAAAVAAKPALEAPAGGPTVDAQLRAALGTKSNAEVIAQINANNAAIISGNSTKAPKAPVSKPPKAPEMGVHYLRGVYEYRVEWDGALYAVTKEYIQERGNVYYVSLTRVVDGETRVRPIGQFEASDGKATNVTAVDPADAEFVQAFALAFGRDKYTRFTTKGERDARTAAARIRRGEVVAVATAAESDAPADE